MAKTPLNVRIEQDIREQLQRLAKEENRTLSNLVETVLLDYVQRKRQSGKQQR